MLTASVAILAVLTLSQSDGYRLSYSPSIIEPQYTANVTLTCHPGGQSLVLGPPLNMRILKEDEASHWQVVAQVEANKPGVTVYEANLTTSGHIGNFNNDSYLTIIWSLATSNIFGRYRCDVVGYDLNQNLIQDKSEEMVLSSRDATPQELLALVREVKESLNMKYRELLGKLVDIEKTVDNKTQIENTELAEIDRNIITLNSTMNNYASLIIGRVNQIDQNLTNYISHLSSIVENLITGFTPSSQDGSIWPGGSYGLLATTSGCPGDNGGAWLTGYRKHETDATDSNHDAVSPNNHLQQPVQEKSSNKNFIYEHFCLMSSKNWDVLWPRGTYCILSHEGTCPFGFDVGYIMWDDEDSSIGDGTVPTGTYDTSTSIIYYCCRSDQPTITPAHLPTGKPFYLYRYHGHCQKVTGMKFTEEFLLFDTENDGNQDHYDSSIHPDGQANNDVKLQLCYYEPE